MCCLEKLLPVEYKRLISLDKYLQRNRESQTVVRRIVLFMKTFVSFSFQFFIVLYGFRKAKRRTEVSNKKP